MSRSALDAWRALARKADSATVPCVSLVWDEDLPARLNLGCGRPASHARRGAGVPLVAAGKPRVMPRPRIFYRAHKGALCSMHSAPRVLLPIARGCLRCGTTSGTRKGGLLAYGRNGGPPPVGRG